ncbi:hypothetical protein Hrubri_0082 [Herbaspirillum rubrisubalbicans M1]|nr:hypothetical protein Hrubri_0082 [Herbaspirillum rubrisubalbicans M1]
MNPWQGLLVRNIQDELPRRLVIYFWLAGAAWRQKSSKTLAIHPGNMAGIKVLWPGCRNQTQERKRRGVPRGSCIEVAEMHQGRGPSEGS